jgi:hypothetical protein
MDGMHGKILPIRATARRLTKTSPNFAGKALQKATGEPVHVGYLNT